jgi:hypothetical protein
MKELSLLFFGLSVGFVSGAIIRQVVVADWVIILITSIFFLLAIGIVAINESSRNYQ